MDPFMYQWLKFWQDRWRVITWHGENVVAIAAVVERIYSFETAPRRLEFCRKTTICFLFYNLHKEKLPVKIISASITRWNNMGTAL